MQSENRLGVVVSHLHLLMERELPPDLDVVHEKKFLTQDEVELLLSYLKSDEVLWNRPKYQSERFGKECTTPCWCTVQGGLKDADLYQPIALPIQKIQRRIEERLNTTFNVVLLRLYFGDDEIAYHTDARAFLGDSCSVASISLGATRRFDMKRVNGPLWPEICKGGGGEGGENVSKKSKSTPSEVIR